MRMVTHHAGASGDDEDDALARLARSSGMSGDAADEHWRWCVYRRAFDVPAMHDVLRRAVTSEPDLAVAVGVGLEMVERDGDGADEWIAAMPLDGRERVARRARECTALRAALAPSSGSPRPDVEGWSDWLQTRVASQADDTDLLAALAECGRTRRIRAAARGRLERLRVADARTVGQGGERPPT